MNNKIAFDIGANSGKMTHTLKNHFSKVIAFEANPRLANHLKTAFLNDRVIVDCRGISNVNGLKKFNICEGDNTISTFSEDWMYRSRFTDTRHWNEEIDVQVITLEHAVKEYGVPDYIKIDVEGHEYEILTATTTLLPKTIIAFEWAEEQKTKIEQILVHLYELGYKQYSYTHYDHLLLDHEIKWVDYSEFNFLSTLIPTRKETWGMLYVKHE